MKRVLLYSFAICVSLFNIQAQAEQSEIRAVTFGDMRSSQPGVNRDAFSDDILVNVVEPLVVHRADTSIAPMAAENYSISDDLTEFTFTLRKNLLFHNGEKVFAKHAVANWHKILDSKTGFQCLPFYNGKLGSKVLSVKETGPYTFTITLDKPSPFFLEQLAYIQCPIALLHPSSWDEDGNWIKPVATGPYKLKEWKKGRHVLLEKFDQYVPRSDETSGLAGKKIPYADLVKFIVLSDQMAAKAALVSGQVDLIPSLAPISALEMRKNKRVTTLDAEGAVRRTILIQTDNPLLSNVLIRRAIAHALDMETFADIASLGLAAPNPSTIPSSNLNHTEAHKKPYEFDLEKAKRLLAEAGYNGEEITIKTTRVEQAIFDIAMIAEAMLKKAGFNIKVEVLEMAGLLGSYFSGDFELIAFEYSPRLTAFMGYHSMIGDKKTTPSRWGDALANELLIKVSTVADPDERQAIFDQIHTHMMAEVPNINLYNAPIVDVISKRIEGYEPWIGSKPRMWNVKVKQQ